MTAVIIIRVDDKTDGSQSMAADLVEIGSAQETSQAVQLAAILSLMEDSENFLNAEQIAKVNVLYKELAGKLSENIRKHNNGRWN